MDTLQYNLTPKKQVRKLGFLKGKVKFSVVGDGKITEEEFLNSKNIIQNS
jgi:hypothetical protein